MRGEQEKFPVASALLCGGQLNTACRSREGGIKGHYAGTEVQMGDTTSGGEQGTLKKWLVTRSPGIWHVSDGAELVGT